MAPSQITKELFQKKTLNKLVVSNQEFSKAIDRVSTVSMEKSRAVKLSLGKIYCL